MYRGIVATFNDDRGFGFLGSAELGRIFVHRFGIIQSGESRTLIEGEEVTFDVEYQSDTRARAVNVRRMNVGGL